MVASCGTALTPQQAQLLRRFAGKVVLSFDPDAAGQGAAVRSCEMLVGEGFTVNVALLPPGEDPDTFVRRHGREAYQEQLRLSQPYLEFLLDRASREHDLGSDEGRRGVPAGDAGGCGQDPRCGRSRSVRRSACRTRPGSPKRSCGRRSGRRPWRRRTALTDRELPVAFTIKPAERGLIWALVHEPAAALAALGALEDEDLQALAARRVFEMARSLHGATAEQVPITAAGASKRAGGAAGDQHRRRSDPFRPRRRLRAGACACCGTTASGPRCSAKSTGCSRKRRRA